MLAADGGRYQLRENSDRVGTLTRMRRRGVTVILGALITALLAAGVMVAPLPYVVLKPGPTVNTLGSDNGTEVIQVKKGEVSTSQGQLRLTTVNVQSQERTEHSLLAWMRRLIRVRQSTRVFSRGSMTMLSPRNHRVLAYLRTF